MNGIDTSAPDPTAYHPLFPPPDGADEDAYPPNATTIASINVIRHSAKGQDWCPRTFQPYELPDLATLAHLFGGGFFELVAKDGKGRVLRRVRYPISGDPKPFEGETPSARHDAPAPMLAATPQVPGLDPMVAFMISMQREQMQMQMAAQAQMTQVLVAALGGRPQSDPAAMAAAMSSAMGQAFTAAATINAAHAPQPTPPNSLGALREALTIAKEVQAAGSAADDIPATVAAVAQAVATVAPMLKAAHVPPAG